jgi:hypothetical protein
MKIALRKRSYSQPMKQTLLVLSAACMLTGCAGVKVVHVDVATGATKPRAIYIRSYIADDAIYKGRHENTNERPYFRNGEKPIRRSLAPAAFSDALKVEMEKMAPAMVLTEDETAHTGWLVESNLEWVHAGSPALRALPLHTGLGRSFVLIHVRITDLEHHHGYVDSKDASKGRANGDVIYEFDLAGGSSQSSKFGSEYAPGLGYAEPFDFKNAAERVMLTLSTDPFRYGDRSSPSVQ